MKFTLNSWPYSTNVKKLIADKIIKALHKIEASLRQFEYEEILVEDFLAINHLLDEMNLSVNNEEVFDHLFQKFCIGK